MPRQFRGPARKEKAWIIGVGAVSIDFVGNSTLSGGFRGFTSGKATVLRMLGEYSVVPTTTPTAGDEAVLTVGIGKVSTDAATLGATALPDPADEPEYPWLYWASHPLQFQAATLDPNAAAANLRVAYDIKSMRKFSASEALVMVIQYGTSVGDPTLTMLIGNQRVLIALD